MHPSPLFPSIATAVEALDAMFPALECVVCDGDDEQVSGVIQAASSPAAPPMQRVARGASLYSFRIELRSDENEDGPQEVAAVHIGEIGRYCGTADEIGRFERLRDRVAAEADPG